MIGTKAIKIRSKPDPLVEKALGDFYKNSAFKGVGNIGVSDLPDVPKVVEKRPGARIPGTHVLKLESGSGHKDPMQIGEDAISTVMSNPIEGFIPHYGYGTTNPKVHTHPAWDYADPTYVRPVYAPPLGAATPITFHGGTPIPLSAAHPVINTAFPVEYGKNETVKVPNPTLATPKIEKPSKTCDTTKEIKSKPAV